MSEPSITERHLDSDPDMVWEAIADPELLGQWLDAEVDVEMHEGAEGTIRFDDGPPAVVLVETIDEGRRLVFRWATPTDAPSEVAIELEPVEGPSPVTVVRVVERPIAPGAASRHVAQAMAFA